MEQLLALNIGDSFIKYGLCDEDGAFVEGSLKEVPSHADGSPYDFISTMHQVLSPLKGKVAKAGVSVSAPFDYQKGVFRMTKRFAAMRGQGIGSLFASYGIAPLYLNDSTAFLLGEMASGVAWGRKSGCAILLGTHMGFAIAKEGRVLVTEADYPVVDLAQKRFHDGTVEDYVARQALRREYHQLSSFPDLVDVDEINRRAEGGDIWARKVFNDAGTNLADAIKSYVPHRLRGDFIVLGGKIAYASRFLAPPISNLLGMDVVRAGHVDDAILRGIGLYLAQGREACVWTVAE